MTCVTYSLRVANNAISILRISFPGATNETLLQKFNSVHKESPFYEKPQKKENAFIIRHYAGKVKYQVCRIVSSECTD